MFDIRYKSHHDVKNVIDKMMKRKIVTPFTFNKVMKRSPKVAEGGIYVHTPYCDKICSFCNMNRKQVDNDLNDYTDFLCKEFKKYGAKICTGKKDFCNIFRRRNTYNLQSCSARKNPFNFERKFYTYR